MRQTRLFVNQPLAPGSEIQLGSEASHYLGNVLRLREDALLHVFNGEGGYYIARVILGGKKSVTILPEQYIDQEAESVLELTLIQGISRGRKMDYTIQKAVELGVKRIIPVVTEFSQIRLTEERADKRMAHWRGVVISACEQCGRNRIPVVEPPIVLSETSAGDHGTGLVLHPEAVHTLTQCVPRENRITLLAGPEGGLSERDLHQAQDAGFISVSLGPRILRTETASVAALAACQVLWGDLGSRD